MPALPRRRHSEGRENAEGVLRLLPSRRVLLATNGGGDIHDVAVTSAFVLVLDGLNHIGVPENGVAGCIPG